MASRAAAERGAEVVLLEEHPEVGKPVYCAEGLSLNGLRDAGVEPSPVVVSQEIKKARVIAPNGSFVELKSTDWVGYTLNRDVFDRTLAENAVKAGAELFTGTRARRVIKEGGAVVGVEAEQAGELLRIDAKVVMGADGYASVVRRSSGLGRWYPDVVTCAQYQLGGLSLEEPEVNEFHLGARVAPGGYAWVFPKSSKVANVGLGVRRIHKEPPIEYLKRFVESDPRFDGAEVLKRNGGVTPCSGMLGRIVDDNLMLVGDAAGQLIPCTGAGIHSGVEAGKMAGEVAARAVAKGDTSKSSLSEYVRRFEACWGKRIRDSRKVIEMLDRFNDEDLNALAEVITNEDVLSLANGTDVPMTLARLIRRSPTKIIRLLAAYVR